jgi:hypothetical protein
MWSDVGGVGEIALRNGFCMDLEREWRTITPNHQEDYLLRLKRGLKLNECLDQPIQSKELRRKTAVPHFMEKRRRRRKRSMKAGINSMSCDYAESEEREKEVKNRKETERIFLGKVSIESERYKTVSSDKWLSFNVRHSMPRHVARQLLNDFLRTRLLTTIQTLHIH